MNKNLMNCRVGDHMQAEGMMMYDTLRDVEGKVVMKMLGFQPYEDPAFEVEQYVGHGKIQILRDGTVDAEVKRRTRIRSKLIHRTTHGRASLTADGAIQLTLKFWMDKEENIHVGMKRECNVLLRAIKDHENKNNN